MKISLKVTLVLMLIALSAFQLPKLIAKKVDKEIKSTFQIEAFSITPITVNETIKKNVSTQINTNNLYTIITDNQLIGYAYVSKAPSKTDQFDYVVLFNPQLEIVKVKVLIYREDYGNEIGSKRWLKQFVGKTAKDTLRYGDNVDAISGATISANSMTKTIQKLLKGVAVLKENKTI